MFRRPHPSRRSPSVPAKSGLSGKLALRLGIAVFAICYWVVPYIIQKVVIDQAPEATAEVAKAAGASGIRMFKMMALAVPLVGVFIMLRAQFEQRRLRAKHRRERRLEERLGSRRRY